MSNYELVSERVTIALQHPSDRDGERQFRLENLRLCFDKVRPTTHAEYVFCVWAHDPYERKVRKLEMFCQRRRVAGWESPYSIVDPVKWGLPETYGIFIFREQFHVLLAELTGTSHFWNGPLMLRDILQEKLSFDDFCRLLNGSYSKLERFEKERLFEMISNDSKQVLPYYFCSSIVDRCLSQ